MMANPFPGMNPYLEQPDYWSDFHNQLIASLARALIPYLRPKYRVVTDKWAYQVTDISLMTIGRPDVTIQQRRSGPTPPASSSITSTLEPPPLPQPIQIRLPQPQELQQSYIQVKDTATQNVITTIELLSPANKQGEGRKKYLEKRQAILNSQTHLVEIDLLRASDPMPLGSDIITTHYRILLSRSNTRPLADLYPFNLDGPIPQFRLPLQPEDIEPIVDLQGLVNELYEQLGYDDFIDYQQAPPFPWQESEIRAILGEQPVL